MLAQVRWDEGPWIPHSGDGQGAPPEDRDSMHSGIGGLAHVLAEIRAARVWTDEESALADAVVTRLRAQVGSVTDVSYFDGLVSTIGALEALGADGTEDALARIDELATPDGWPQQVVAKVPGARLFDVTLGASGVLLAALWARRLGRAGAADLASRSADLVLAEGEPREHGTTWMFVPTRFVDGSGPGTEMPNWSHGTAGVAAALAVAGTELGRPDLLEAARQGAEYLVSIGDREADRFVVPRYLPRDLNDEDEVTYTWCHGASGTSLAFRALDRAGVATVAGEPPAVWHRRLLRSVRSSGLPARTYPGFWDNDGRCCGTTGVGDVFLDAWQRDGVDDDLAFAIELADVLVERAVREGPHACWRFVEHRAAEPLLPPGVGWMQGAAGIAAYLFRTARLLDDGREAACVPRLDTWWALPEGPER